MGRAGVGAYRLGSAQQISSAIGVGEMGDEQRRKQEKPVCSVGDALEFSETHFGLQVSLDDGPIRELESYDDRNFLMSGSTAAAPDCAKYTFKVHNGVESDNYLVLEAQNAILQHLQKHGVNCPQPMPAVPEEPEEEEAEEKTKKTKKKEPELMAWAELSTEWGSKHHAVRLLTWIEGTPMSEITQPPTGLYYRAGVHLGEVTEALADFDHPAAHRVHSWDLMNTSELRDMAWEVHIEPEQQQMILSVVDRFEAIQDFQVEVDWQVLHGDFNNANLICKQEAKGDWQIVGVLDVGDMVYSCRVNDLAVGIAYMLIAAVTAAGNCRAGKPFDPIQAASLFYAGYNIKIPLSSTEKRALHTLVACRLALSFTFGMYSAAQDPQNEYLLLHAEPAWDALKLWWDADGEVEAMFAKAVVSNAYRK